jgi:hypothetical protein
LEKAITVVGRVECHVEANKRKILGFSKKGYAYDKRAKEEGILKCNK